jgi:hypothetical protein
LHLSCGLASFTSGMSVQDLVDAADRDMYLQKPRTREKATTLRSPL